MNSYFSGAAVAITLVLSCIGCSSDAPEVIETKDPVVVTPPEVTNISWKNWYLSVPIDRGDGSATSIGYTSVISDKLTAEQSDYFYKNEDDSYTMYTKFTGFTTSGTYALDKGKYCRTELREYWQGNQDTSDNWSMKTGTHILESTLQVEFCESGSVIVAQIHGKESPGISGNPPTVKVFWKNNNITLRYYTKPDVGEPWTSEFESSIKMGAVNNEAFTIKIKIEDGKLYAGLVCDATSIDSDYSLVYDYVSNGYVHENYFKTGNYFIWDEDTTKASQVKLLEVLTVHN